MLQFCSVGAKVHIYLDENLLVLKHALKDNGFKVTVFKRGTLDQDMLDELTNGLLLTKNAKDFTDHAVSHDFDIIDVASIKFIDPEKSRKNGTVRKIATAIGASGIAYKKGNFHLVVKNDGLWIMTQLSGI